MTAPRTGLDDESIEIIARRVVELIREQRVDVTTQLVDAKTLGGVLGLSTDWIYAHADELGAVALGDGARPRKRFDVAQAAAALRARAQQPATVPTRPSRGRPRRRRSRTVPLLPIGPER